MSSHICRLFSLLMLPLVAASWSLIAQAQVPTPTTIAKISGDNQSRPPNTTLLNDFVVEVRTATGALAANVDVDWYIESGSGSMNPAPPAGSTVTTTRTNGAGRAAIRFSLGSGIGARTVSAAIGCGPIIKSMRKVAPGLACTASTLFTATVPDAVLAISGGNNQSIKATQTTNDLAVQLTQAGEAIPSATIAWSVVTAGAGSMTAATSTTDAKGVAVSRFTANNTTGTRTIRATYTPPPRIGGATLTQDFTVTVAPLIRTLTKVSGDNQTGSSGTPLPADFVVRLDQEGLPLADREILWRVTSGTGTVSATFSVTNAAGNAATRLTMSAGAGARVVEACLAVSSTAGAICDTTVAPVTFTATVPAALAFTIQSGNNQAIFVNQTTGDLAVLFTTDGQPIANQPVNWKVESGTGTLTTATSATNSSGIATTRFTADNTAGPRAISATLGTTPVGFVGAVIPPPLRFNVTVNANVFAFEKVSGDDQRLAPGSRPEDLVARVLLNGKPLAERSVKWRFGTGTGSLSQAESLTDANGLARTQLAPSSIAGIRTIVASTDGLPPLTYTVTVLDGTPPNERALTLVSGNNQRAVPNRPLPQPLVVNLSAGGKPVAGTAIAFTITRGGGTLGTPSAQTDANGNASTTFTADAQPGARQIEARASTGERVVFDIALADADISPVSGEGQTVRPGGTTQDLVVRVASDGNPLPNTPVTWTVEGCDAQLASTTTTTNAQGETRNRLTLGRDGKACRVIASSPNAGDARFTVSVAATAFGLQLISGGNQIGTINAPLAEPIVVRLNDGGTAVVGETVQFAFSLGTGTLEDQALSSKAAKAGTPTLAARTGQDGTVRVKVTLGGEIGPRVLRASFAGLTLDIPFNSAPSPAAANAANYATLPLIGIEALRLQQKNIRCRMEKLRTSGSGSSSCGISFQIDGRALPLPTLRLDEIGKTLTGKGAPFVPTLSAASGANSGPAIGAEFEPNGFFLNGQISVGKQAASDRGAGFKLKTRGLTGGYDRRIRDDLVIGAALGVIDTDSTFNAGAGNQDTRGAYLSAFGTYYLPGNYYVDGILSAGQHRYDSRRSLGAAFGDIQLSGTPRGQQLGASLSFGRNFYKDNWTIGPYGRLEYVSVDVGSFTESGPEWYALNVGKQNVNSVTATLGLQASKSFSLSWGILAPAVRLEYERQLRANGRFLKTTFINDPLATEFALPADRFDRSYGTVGLGLAATWPNGRSAFANVEHSFGRTELKQTTVSVGFRQEF